MSPRPGGRAVWNYNELEMQDDVAEPVTDEQILEDLEAVFCRVPISSALCVFLAPEAVVDEVLKDDSLQAVWPFFLKSACRHLECKQF